MRERAHVADRHGGRARRDGLRRRAEEPLVERVRHDERRRFEGRATRSASAGVETITPSACRARNATTPRRGSPRVRLPRLVAAEVEEVVVELVDDGNAPPPAPGKHADESVQLPLVRPESVPLDDEEVAVGNRLRGSVRQLDLVRQSAG